MWLIVFVIYPRGWVCTLQFCQVVPPCAAKAGVITDRELACASERIERKKVVSAAGREQWPVHRWHFGRPKLELQPPFKGRGLLTLFVLAIG